MARKPIVFALANPTPEIMPEEAARVAFIVATGPSDYPNQINNVLAFPGIFRGALNVRARRITEEMKLAAAKAIADCISQGELSPEYIVPSVFKREVVQRVAEAVRRAVCLLFAPTPCHQVSDLRRSGLLDGEQAAFQTGGESSSPTSVVECGSRRADGCRGNCGWDARQFTDGNERDLSKHPEHFFGTRRAQTVQAFAILSQAMQRRDELLEFQVGFRWFEYQKHQFGWWETGRAPREWLAGSAQRKAGP
jgi:hypothetical protein